MTNITIGQYLPFDSFIHKLDPRVKIIGVFLYIITTVSYTHLTLPTKA